MKDDYNMQSSNATLIDLRKYQLKNQYKDGGLSSIEIIYLIQDAELQNSYFPQNNNKVNTQ